MIEKYYNGVIEQVYNKLGKSDNNIVMVSYNNGFSISKLESVKRYLADDNVVFAYHEYENGRLCGAYEPFLDIVRDMLDRNSIDIEEFMKECDVYELHRSLLKGYFEEGTCYRREGVLLNEVGYEQTRLCRAIADMLHKLSEKTPILIVLNRFQISSRSTMELIWRLINEPSSNIGIVLGVNEKRPQNDILNSVWEEIYEYLEEHSHIYHIGSSGKEHDTWNNDILIETRDYDKILEKIKYMYEFLDYEQAKLYLQDIECKIKFEDVRIDEGTLCKYYVLYTYNSILLAELSKALEMVNYALQQEMVQKSHSYMCECYYLKGTCLMYQGKLQMAEKYAKQSRHEAKLTGDEDLIFRAELLTVMAKMSGWYNIFFCVKDVHIDETLIEKLMKNGYKNHLAHIYIYAYDNGAEMVAKAYRSEAYLMYFSKGVALAVEIGNEQLVYDAYQKNIMIASTNGMHEIAMLYSVRTYEFLRTKGNILYGRILSGIGYNLSAMGKNDEAMEYYEHAIRVFYRLRVPEDIAEVYYNMSLSYIMQEQYAKAENSLLLVMKAIDKLHLNSLRVCNLSKLYGLLALLCILQNDRFNCERYLLNCRQFLNYIIEKEEVKKDMEVIHDFAKWDDDMFLYTFSLGLLKRFDGDKESALQNFDKAEKFLQQTEGNEFFCYRIFRRERMKFFKDMGKSERYEHEEMILKQYEDINADITDSFLDEILKSIDLNRDTEDIRISERDIESLIKHEGLMRDYKTSRRQMEFITTWQKLIDVTDNDVDAMVKNALNTFMNHFSLDCALYICYHDEEAHVLYNDTGCVITDEINRRIGKIMLEYPQGFAISKISDNFLEHQDIASFFGIDDVCSLVAVPFIKKGRLTSLFITYVRMKDNWHGSIERYMLNESDLKIYSLLFREMEYAINRMESNQKIYEMNSKLHAAAVTDALTGIYNRAGMYSVIKEMIDCYSTSDKQHDIGLMFIDLDNFKIYNDTFGHDVGDLILKEMASIFQIEAIGYGFVSRYGGDEFIIILDTADDKNLEKIAKNIYAKIESSDGFKKQIEDYLGHPISVDKDSRITCSMGIAKAGNVKCEEDINNLIHQADELLYKVKTREKGNYAFWDYVLN